MEVNVQLSSENFIEEWERLKKAKGNISVEKILESYVKDKEDSQRIYFSFLKVVIKNFRRDDDLKNFRSCLGLEKNIWQGSMIIGQ
ncbi:MAG: hypothetical protein ACLSEY_11635 [Enterocloster sp.]